MELWNFRQKRGCKALLKIISYLMFFRNELYKSRGGWDLGEMLGRRKLDQRNVLRSEEGGVSCHSKLSAGYY